MTKDYESPGSFYLGRKHLLENNETLSEPLLYKSKDLTTHAVCVGMTGSGKTGLCLSLIEEAALDGIPVIAIDPKGDLGNLLLTFPDLKPADFRPWIDESVATRKGISPDDFAEKTADLWRNGLGKWDQDGERIKRFADKVDRTIYTPASSSGIPLTVLKSFDAPAPEVMADRDSLCERVSSTASGLLALLGIDADPIKSREHILLSNLLSKAWKEGRSLDIAGLIGEIQNPPIEKIGVLDLETFFSKKNRTEFAMSLNNLLASPSFQSWMEGETLNIQRLFYTEAGKPRISILSIAHLNDEERMFFVTILLSELVAWMRAQSGTSSLRAILYMDEVFGYFPPTANPPSKKPMLTLLKQARAFGLGIVLSTQNPVDLDYKGLSNAGTWFLGRLQTERDKMRVLEGLEGASAQAGTRFDKQKMEATLAGLGSRVFLLNNVHEDEPVIFHTRWALSYLRGPLTRHQIAILMADRKKEMASQKENTAEPAPEKTPAAPKATEKVEESLPPLMPQPPTLDKDIPQRFVKLKESLPKGAQLEYHPAICGWGTSRFLHKDAKLEYSRPFSVFANTKDEIPNDLWENATPIEENQIDQQPIPGALFQTSIPDALTQDKNYRQWEQDLKENQYHQSGLSLFQAASLDLFSEHGESPESKEDFKKRAFEVATKKLEEETAKISKRYEDQINTASRRKWWSYAVSFFPAILKFILGLIATSLSNKTAKGIANSTADEIGKTGRRGRGKSKSEKAAEAQLKLETARDKEIAKLEASLDPNSLDIEEISVRPFKKDIYVKNVVLAWLPWITVEGRTKPGW